MVSDRARKKLTEAPSRGRQATLRLAGLGAAVAGAVIGFFAARLVAMTSMPEMVALFNGSGGIASLLVGWAAINNVGNTTFTMVTIVLSILIGGITTTGSLIAYGKLAEIMAELTSRCDKCNACLAF